MDIPVNFLNHVCCQHTVIKAFICIQFILPMNIFDNVLIHLYLHYKNAANNKRVNNTNNDNHNNIIIIIIA